MQLAYRSLGRYSYLILWTPGSWSLSLGLEWHAPSYLAEEGMAVLTFGPVTLEWEYQEKKPC